MHTTADIQKELMRRGYDVGPDGADGVAGSKTRQALAEFQLDNGLPQTNKADAATMLLLFPEDYKPRTTAMQNILGGIFTGLLGNLIRSQAVMGYIRNALIGLGTAGFINGLVTTEQWTLLVGAVMTILGVVFDAISNSTKQKAIDVVKAVDAAPAVTVIPASETPTKKPVVVVQP